MFICIDRDGFQGKIDEVGLIISRTTMQKKLSYKGYQGHIEIKESEERLNIILNK